MRCPCCGANLIYKGKMKVCDYCGYEEKDTSVFKDYNVLVSYPAGTVSYFKIEGALSSSRVLIMLRYLPVTSEDQK